MVFLSRLVRSLYINFMNDESLYVNKIGLNNHFCLDLKNIGFIRQRDYTRVMGYNNRWIMIGHKLIGDI